jgi:putative ABC transport system permease protein
MGMYRLVSTGLLSNQRALMGGDVQIDAREAIPQPVLDWIKQYGNVSLSNKVNTMLGTEKGEISIVELQSVDELYPLYGKLILEPSQSLRDLTAFADGYWGIAVDPYLAEKLEIHIDDTVSIGNLKMKVRAIIKQQPDRRLSANWRGTPVLLSDEALQASGLIKPGSRIDYDYFLRTDTNSEDWRDLFYASFPEGTWEVKTFLDNSNQIAERLQQIASGFIIIALSTLFIGGLGVYNAIQGYLNGKFKTIATLRALGLRNRKLSAVYLLQVGILSGGSSLLGVMIGSGLSLAGAAVVFADVPAANSVSSLILPNLGAILFGLLTAYTFAFPAIGHAISVQPATLFRSVHIEKRRTSFTWRWATICCGFFLVSLVWITVPDTIFGIGFITIVGALLLILDFIVRGLKRTARSFEDHPILFGRFVAKLAIANLHRPGTPLRTSLLSLGSALTLLVACTIVVASLVRALNDTIPRESPDLVLYDVQSFQREDVVRTLKESPGSKQIEMVPLVISRITHINSKPLAEITAIEQDDVQEALRDEFKLSHSAINIDKVKIVEGAWWKQPVTGLPKMALEDREANILKIKLGDMLTFDIEGQPLKAEVAAIYRQKGMQTRFWFEGILSVGALDPFVHTYVGAAYMHDAEVISTQIRLAKMAPNVVTLRTASMLSAARDLLRKASVGLAVLAAISFTASLLVLISVIATGRTRQIYDATVLHCLGTRLSVIKKSLLLEYMLLAVITSFFAVLLGTATALPLVHWQLRLPSEDLIWLGGLTAVLVSLISLSLGAKYLMRRLQIKPTILLNSAD